MPKIDDRSTWGYFRNGPCVHPLAWSHWRPRIAGSGGIGGEVHQSEFQEYKSWIRYREKTNRPRLFAQARAAQVVFDCNLLVQLCIPFNHAL